MGNGDPFGIQREARIVSSGVRKIFTPHKPVDSVELFFGRQNEVGRIIEQINTPGQHALLYGDRGVGKSSLANITRELVLEKLVPSTYVKRCDSSDTFQSVVAEPVAAAFRADGKVSLNLFRNPVEDMPRSPSAVALALQRHRGLLLIDEADAIPTLQAKTQLAELIKLLSDMNSPLKVLVVGIAETGTVLTGAHPSVSRCLKETQLGRMSDSEIALIITGGAGKAHLRFEVEVVEKIVTLSAGYPHFTHLLALKCAEEAVASGRQLIRPRHLTEVMMLAVHDAEGSLLRTYNDAIRSPSDMYRKILLGAAMVDTPEISAAVLRESIRTHTGVKVTQPELNNYFQRLVSTSTESILRRVSKGVYRFNDPRMRSFIKMANQIQ